MPPSNKLHRILPLELQRDAPLSLLLSQRVPLSVSEYPLHYLLAVEVPHDVHGRYLRYTRVAR